MSGNIIKITLNKEDASKYNYSLEEGEELKRRIVGTHFGEEFGICKNCRQPSFVPMHFLLYPGLEIKCKCGSILCGVEPVAVRYR